MKNLAQTDRLILGIESSCDETAAALVTNNRQILSQQIASSAELHARYGGVIPEIAARQHLDMITPIIEATLEAAGKSVAQLDGIAATGGPGLIGGVLVGTMVAKAMASACQIPYFAINHLEGHALSARLTDNLEFPYLLLLVSGGHTQLLAVHGPGHYQRYGTTMDDAAGETFDKGASVLGLSYPGGPAIEECARQGNAKAIALPRPRLGADDCHFSFSGLKTALSQKWQKSADTSSQNQADFAASLQAAIADCLIDRLSHALDLFTSHTNSRRLVIAGGVAANAEIGSRIAILAEQRGYALTIPPPELCTDNGAMIAWAGQEYLALGRADDLDFAPRPRWPLDPEAAPPPGRGVRP